MRIMTPSPRNSALFWDNSRSTTAGGGRIAQSDSANDYFVNDDEDLEEQERLMRDGDEDEDFDGRTPLDRTIDRIGMGSYQWTLLSLCGLGWMADNMWIQAVAIILPRVQQHYDVPDSYIGTVSSAMFAGMMLGAVGWGTCSDLMGRITAFNATLFFTAVFGILAALSNSFPTLCLTLFLLGSSVGGSMPTDGTLLLEHMPKSKQYLVTALSVFFSFGAVLAAVLGLLVIPQNSCLPSRDTSTQCDPATDNQGWKYLLAILALLTLSMFLARMVFFRLHESPRYLVHAGRPHDAIKSLELISRFNGSDLSVALEDVRDTHPTPAEDINPTDGRPRATSRTVFNAHVIEDARTAGGSGEVSRAESADRGNRPALVTAYAATGETPALAMDKKVASLEPKDDETLGGEDATTVTGATINAETNTHLRVPADSGDTARRPIRRRGTSGSTSRRQRASMYEQKLCWSLPRWIRRPLWAWWDRVMMVLSPEWRRTTILVWAAWWAMSLAYTMFNVFLPKLLETGSSLEPDLSNPKSLEQSLWDVVIFTIGGCPGAILGAWLIESPLGRRRSLAGSTLATAVFCVAFALVKGEWAVRASTVGISLSATAMWAVLYGWTPEIFGTKVRGSACGIASALSRIGGMIAPILGGVLLMMDRTLPVYTSVGVFIAAAAFVLMLPEAPRDVLHAQTFISH